MFLRKSSLDVLKMPKIEASTCVTAVLIILILLVGGVILAFFILYSRIRKESEDSIKAFCSDVKGFIKYMGNLSNPVPDGYDQTTAAFLLTTDLNVTIANCSKFSDVFPAPPDFDVVVPLKQTFDGVERTIGYFFYSTKLKTMLISFTGTFFFDQWESDLNFLQVDPKRLNNYEKGIKIHEGFYNIYLAIRDQLLDEVKKYSSEAEQLVITGHSLGGALSTITTFDLAKNKSKPVNYTFSSHRVVNIDFDNKYDSFDLNTQRVFNTSDVVPDLPPPVLQDSIYEHVGTNIPFTQNLGDLTKNHIDAYQNFTSG